MTAARKSALVLTLAAACLVLGSASALAQICPTNPSGGTSLRQTREEGSGTVRLTDYLSRGLSIDHGVRGWLSSYAVSRFVVPAASRPVSRWTLPALVQRWVWAH